MSKELCDCGKIATYCYMPGYSSGDNPYSCDDCVPRGCSCNHNNILEEYKNEPEGVENIDYRWIDELTWTYIDEQKREYPCVEHFYSEDGWDIDEN
jgi:hypothetical protein